MHLRLSGTIRLTIEHSTVVGLGGRWHKTVWYLIVCQGTSDASHIFSVLYTLQVRDRCLLDFLLAISKSSLCVHKQRDSNWVLVVWKWVDCCCIVKWDTSFVSVGYCVRLVDFHFYNHGDESLTDEVVLPDWIMLLCLYVKPGMIVYEGNKDHLGTGGNSSGRIWNLVSSMYIRLPCSFCFFLHRI